MAELTFEVDEMSCARCAARVEGAIRSVHGARATRVTLDPGRAVVEVDDGVTPADVARAITAAGYPARPLSPSR
jgi:P-type Cu+ transporter